MVDGEHALISVSKRSLPGLLLVLITILLLTSCVASLPRGQLVAKPAKAGECVILLHGLARSSASMKQMKVALLAHDYSVINMSYPSRDFTVEQLSEIAIPEALAGCRSQGATRIHIVSHSMGGILTRHYLNNHRIAELGRFIMLATPNQGSQVIDKLTGFPGFAWFMGPAGLQLGTRDTDLPLSLGPVEVDTAVIAGSKSINLVLSLYLPNPDDGKVSVANTRVEGMCAHLTVPVAHPFIMKDARVITQVLSYLSTGAFDSDRAEYFDCAALQAG